MSTRWEVVIGLEIHVQLKTESKLFSGASTAYGAEPNAQACAVDLAMPGMLPVLNERALELAARFGKAINAEIARESVFARKNYFYPDLPKGYQISQLDQPIVAGGRVSILLDNGEEKWIGITRAHLEEDAGKSVHGIVAGMTGVDLNRAGTPLLEIVSEPDMRSAAEAVAYMRKIHTLVRYLEISDGNMQEGSFRCDVNISLRPQGSDRLGTRTELKNINSFRFVEKAIEHEVERQAWILEDGGEIVQETRLYDPDKNETRSMRTKEEANDYRYFPDPDLLPVRIDEEKLQAWTAELPELPDQRRARYQQQYAFSPLDADRLVVDKAWADYFEQMMAVLDAKQARTAYNWLMVELAGWLNKQGHTLAESPVTAEQLAKLLLRISDGTISGKIGKKVFQKMAETGQDADAIIEAEGLKQISDSGAIEAMVDQVIADFPEQVEQYRAGQDKLLQFLVGQVMKASRGKANPAQVNQLLRDKLNK